MSTNAIATKIESSRAKGALTRREKAANREAVKELAAKHMEAAIRKLGDIVADKNAPASAKVAAATQLLDRVAGKPKLVDERQSEQSQLEKMSAPELIEYISQQFSGLPMSTRAVLSESIAEGIAFDEADLVDIVKLDEPAEREPTPKKVPRR